MRYHPEKLVVQDLKHFQKVKVFDLKHKMYTIFKRQKFPLELQ